MFLAFFLALSLKNVLHFRKELAKPENQKLSFCSVVFIANIEMTKKTIKEKGTEFTVIDLLLYTANLLISSVQVKKFTIFTYLYINLAFLIKLIANNLSMWTETYP